MSQKYRILRALYDPIQCTKNHNFEVRFILTVTFSIFWLYIYIYIVTGQLLSYLSFDVYLQVIRKMIGGTLFLAPFQSVRWYNICHLIDFFQCYLLVVMLKHLFLCNTPPIICDLMVCSLLHHFTSIHYKNIGNSNEIEYLLARHVQ